MTTDENIRRIGELFPNCLTEQVDANGQVQLAVDFDRLRQELSGRAVEGSDEHYQFCWHGKRNAILMANAPTTDMLRPCPEESVDFDTTHNLYIEGDNLPVLKLLRKDYEGRVKLIYIDPPYNTGNDFVYNDHFVQSARAYLHHGEKKDRGAQSDTDIEGRFHTDWLNMIYPRLKVARELLSDDGAIFISIDHNEMVNLTYICDEIFGASNRVGILSVVNNLKGRSDDAFFATSNEFLLVYAKSKNLLSVKGFALEEEELDKDYDQQDDMGYYKLIGFRKTGNAWRREERPHLFYPVLCKQQCFSTVSKEELRLLYNPKTKAFDDQQLKELTERYEAEGYRVIWPRTESGEYGRWRWGMTTFLEQKDFNLALNPSGTLCTKMRATLEDGSLRMKTAKTLWYKSEYGTGNAAKQLSRLMGKSGLFDNPKSLVYMRDILKIATDEQSIVLDFFSGSATTAHAVMQQNALDGGHRCFIMVQNPVRTDEGSEAFRAGYKNICEIGKERIRRAGRQIKAETATRRDAGQDVGFRVLKLTATSAPARSASE